MNDKGLHGKNLADKEHARQHVAGGVDHAHRNHFAPLARVNKGQGKKVAPNGIVERPERLAKENR